MKQKIAIELISVVFIVLFVYAGASKLLDIQTFRVQIGQSPLLTHISNFVSWSIPGIEILVSLILTIPRLRPIGLYCAFTLMVMFTTYIIAILNFSDHIPCSCGGVLENLSWTEHLMFNLGFLLLALFGIIISSEKKTFNTGASNRYV